MKKMVCSKCSKEISFINFAKAGSPWHLKCDHCHSKLKIENSAYVATALVITLIIYSFVIVPYFLKIITFIEFLFLVIIVAIALEIIFYIIFNRLGIELEVKK